MSYRYSPARPGSGRVRSPSRSRAFLSTPLIAFLIVASFGILFAGCSGPKPDETLDEFSFTADDVARLRELAEGQSSDQSMTESGAMEDAPRLVGAEEGEAGSMPSLNLSMVDKYESIRSGSEAVSGNLYRVTNTFLNVRTEPRVNSETVTSLDQGDILEILEFIDAAWAKVRLQTGEQGYIAHRYVGKLTTEEKLAEDKKKFEGLYFVNFGFLNVRAEADSQSDLLGVLSSQMIVRPVSMDQVWARVPFGDGHGYVAVQYLAPFSPNFLVRQDGYTLPILQYRLLESGMLTAFAEHLDRLKQEGYSIITLSAFRDLVIEQEDRDVRLDPKTVVVTVSDITKDNLKDLSDVLRASNVQATLFLQTKNIGLDGITEKDIITLLSNGHDLQSGGHTGEDLRSLTNSQVELELKQSRKILEDIAKREIFAIGFPRGGVNDRVTEKAAGAGYLFGIGAAGARTFVRDQFLDLPGFLVTMSQTGDDLIAKVKGE